MASSVIVVGSANQDYVMSIDALPAPGETRLAESFQKFPGGKGANQAVACARLGVPVSLVGAVGDDADGALIIRDLRSEGIDTSEIEITTSERTGMAIVSVLPGGENTVTVVPGANFTLAPARITRAVQRLAADESIVVVQAEIPVECIEATVLAASAVGARPVLNLAPFVELDAETIGRADPLVVNEVEAAFLTGYVIDGPALAQRAAEDIARRARSAVITLGAAGASWASAEASGVVPALPVANVVDTTGAGDAFIGAVAAMFTEGSSLENAVRVGVEVGALAVTRVGAQASYPLREEVRQLAATTPRASAG
ncbi:ribokinase [Jiangella alkaliphila]|uniref:Ribokinase n=1 Tax=Jiangella alkaliphila TaxID=419479 RepID=A0A1H2LFI5_9ACTN|nr:ribokinase [Jiangella alkaliphila]SDU79166.1 ribokinase [Jiangella alkaliphila]